MFSHCNINVKIVSFELLHFLVLFLFVDELQENMANMQVKKELHALCRTTDRISTTHKIYNLYRALESVPDKLLDAPSETLAVGSSLPCVV